MIQHELIKESKVPGQAPGSLHDISDEADSYSCYFEVNLEFVEHSTITAVHSGVER